MHRHSLAILSLLVVVLFGAAANAQAPEGYDPSFAQWVEKFKQNAVEEGISPQLLDAGFMDVTPDPTVIRLDRKQPENKVTLEKYLSNTVTQNRIEKGRALMVEYADPLRQISARYGVQPRYILALWAIESNYGQMQGNFSVIRSLTTLAYEGRRADFFSKELLNAFRIMQTDNLSPGELRGSWAGAMGNCQFMPSTYLRYAVDANGDGRRDIWNDNIDALASIANYINSLGWDNQQEWGYRAIAPVDFTEKEADIKTSHAASHWRKRGFTINGDPVPDSSTQFYAIYPAKPDEGTLLVTNNFQSLLNWNRSRYFATAVGTLADAIGD